MRSVTLFCVTLLAGCSLAGNDDVVDGGVPFDGALPAVDGALAPDASRSDGDATPDTHAEGATDAGPIATPAGGTLVPGGATFRVWAPHATALHVAGDFNGDSDTASPLAAAEPGWFAGFVAGAKAGDTYKYVIDGPAGRQKRADPRARAMTSSSGASLLVDPAPFAWTDAAFVPPPLAEQVIYELHLGTYTYDVGADRPGTWRAAIDHLDELAALGVNVVEVMPVAEFAGDFGWGYNPAFPMAPERAYGTPDDVRAFVDAAHARGLAVFVDIVHNHWGRGDLQNGFWCFDGDCLGAGNGGAWFYVDGKRDTGFGPRPDFSRVEVRDFIVDDALLWLGDYHCDGLRWDSVVNLRRAGTTDLPEGWALLQRANDAAHAARPGSTMIAEDLQNDDAIDQPTSKGGAGFDAQWDPGFYWPLRGVILAGADADRHMGDVKGALEHAFAGSGLHRVLFSENHDQVSAHNGAGNLRIPTLLDPADPTSLDARRRSTLFAAMVLTAPGVPMLFMGQEWLEDVEFSFSAKVPLDHAKAAAAPNAGVLAMYRDMIRLRRNLDKTSAGLLGAHVEVFHVNDAAKVVGYRRWDAGGDDVVVLANFSGRTFTRYDLGFPATGAWHARLSSDDARYGAGLGGLGTGDVEALAAPRDGQPATGGVALAPYSVVVLSR